VLSALCGFLVRAPRNSLFEFGLPAYVSPLAHTDQLHGLLDALNDVKVLCREKLTPNELTWLIEAHNTLEDILAEVWKPK